MPVTFRKGFLVPVLGAVGALLGLAWLFTNHEEEVPAKAAPPRPRRRKQKRLPRAFISFAVEDEAARNLFVGQSRHSETPFELADFSLHKPFDNSWKTQTRPRIKGCDVVIVLIGEGTHAAEGVLWEIKAAKEEGVPLFGVYIDKGDKGRMPGSLFGIPVINWTWNGIAKQIRKAVRRSRAR
jgi:hypothetical protein